MNEYERATWSLMPYHCVVEYSTSSVLEITSVEWVDDAQTMITGYLHGENREVTYIAPSDLTVLVFSR